MFKRLLRFRDDDRGVATVLFAIVFLPFIFALAIMVMDVGTVFALRRDLQGAADSAALAGAWALRDGTAEAIADAELYAETNVEGVTTEVVVSGDQQQITVTVRKTWDKIMPGFTDSMLPEEIIASATAYVTDMHIDFEDGLSPGETITQLSVGQGISGLQIPGFVTVATIVEDDNYGAMIFDGECGGGPASNCSGGDADLYQPEQGNLLIISEDGDAGDPDDLGAGGTITFDFSFFGTGAVTVESMAIIDAEEDVTVRLYQGAVLVHTEFVTAVTDGSMAVRFIDGVEGITYMEVEFVGSGAVDDIGYQRTAALIR
ncbi:MAG: Flp pilus assembly protein TadG [Chloroflexi bacterium]|nr:MAG: Flp pilus assembly protein TadG [Chloroflexota bacterium]